jgi:hypothetical protein
MAGSRIANYPAPIGGMEWREGYQKEQHAQVLVNVDLSRGILQARKGFVGTADVGSQWGFLHQSHDPTGESFILCIGPSSRTDPSIIFNSLDEWGNAVGANQDLTAAFGEPPDIDFKCSFVNVVLPTQAPPARFVTIISTAHSTYVFEPGKDTDTLRQLNPVDVTSGGDTVLDASDSINYWASRPFGYIAEQHDGSVFYAGFRYGDECQFTGTVEQDQNAIPEAYLNGNRNGLVLGPHVIVYSDTIDPAGIRDYRFFSIKGSEKVTALKSFQENLAIFTDKSIWVFTGFPDVTASPVVPKAYQVDSGVGCVAHRSVIEVGGVVYFMSHDGIYAWGGASAPQAMKISTPIDAVWSGRYDADWVPEAVNATLVEDLKWPWAISHSDSHLCTAVHYKELNQIWWSLPVKSRTDHTMPVTIVFDYVRGAWAFYTRTHVPGDEDLSCGIDLVSIKNRGPERLIGHNGQGDIHRYGHYRDETNSGGDERAIPLVWVSTPMDKDGSTQERVKDVRFRILSQGKKPTSNPPQCFISGEESHFDMKRTTREEKSADLSLHPNDALSSMFLDEVVLDGTSAFWQNRDWFLSKFNARVRSASWRVGILDDGEADDRPSMVHMQSFVAEIKSLGTE